MEKYSIRPRKVYKSFKVDYPSELNPEQLEVVMAEGGPMLVIAGAGSGKTRTITYRVARLIESGVDPSRILLATFTNKASREMLHRAELLIGGDIRGILGGTFHHIGNVLLRHYGHLLGYSNNYTILDREDSKDLIATCVSNLGMDKGNIRFPKGDVLSNIIGLSIDIQQDIEDIITDRYPFFLNFTMDIKKVAEEYTLKKKKLNAMDFDDLLLNWRVLLEKHPKVREEYADRFLHILVDEYQDTNKIQADIIDFLSGGHRNLVVVGDDSQSIYSFRGANFANIIEFPKRYADVRIYKLQVNYRSTPEILSLANDIIRHNVRQFPKALQAVKRGGPRPVLVPLRDVYQQAEFVAQRILELVEEGISLNDVAVLYRSHYHSMELQLEFTRRGIPYVVRSGLRFFEQAHIKDVTAYMKVIVNPLDELAWKRILRLLPKIGRATAEKVWRYLSSSPDPLSAIELGDALSVIPSGASGGWKDFVNTIKRLRSFSDSPSGMVMEVLKDGYEAYLRGSYPDSTERIEDIRQLSEFARQYTSAEQFLNDLALLGTVESEITGIGIPDANGERVVLSTVHQAKGLEWPKVFILWLSEGRFPSAKGMESLESLEEERRLFYVATTRAKEELYLCYPLLSTSYYRATILRPSPFLQELREENYTRLVIDAEIVRLLERVEEEE